MGLWEGDCTTRLESVGEIRSKTELDDPSQSTRKRTPYSKPTQGSHPLPRQLREHDPCLPPQQPKIRLTEANLRKSPQLLSGAHSRSRCAQAVCRTAHHTRT